MERYSRGAYLPSTTSTFSSYAPLIATSLIDATPSLPQSYPNFADFTLPETDPSDNYILFTTSYYSSSSDTSPSHTPQQQNTPSPSSIPQNRSVFEIPVASPATNIVNESTLDTMLFSLASPPPDQPYINVPYSQ